MSRFSHRMQLLLDEERRRRLEHEARRTGRSVASLIREAIDMRLGLGGEAKRRREAAERLLATPRPGGREAEWPAVDQELQDAHELDAT
jgi:hypothetical protein